CSQAEAAGVRAYGLRQPLAILPNGVDAPDTAQAAGPPWPSDDGRRTLLFLGRLHPKKGVRETLEAWALLTERAPAVASAWRLVIAGWDDGGHREELAALARSRGLDSVLFPGPLFGEAKAA